MENESWLCFPCEWNASFISAMENYIEYDCPPGMQAFDCFEAETMWDIVRQCDYKSLPKPINKVYNQLVAEAFEESFMANFTSTFGDYYNPVVAEFLLDVTFDDIFSPVHDLSGYFFEYQLTLPISKETIDFNENNFKKTLKKMVKELNQYVVENTATRNVHFDF